MTVRAAKMLILSESPAVHLSLEWPPRMIIPGDICLSVFGKAEIDT